MTDRQTGLLKLGVVLIAILIGIGMYVVDHRQRVASKFEGVVVERYYRRRGRLMTYPEHYAYQDGTRIISLRSPYYYIGVRTASGLQTYEVQPDDLDNIEEGDYVMKDPGREAFALFHAGQQVKGLGNIRSDTVAVPPGALAAAAPPTPSPTPTAAPARADRDQEIKGLLAQASQLWAAGEKTASIDASQKALTITEMTYGHDSAQYAGLAARVAQARSLAAAH